MKEIYKAFQINLKFVTSCYKGFKGKYFTVKIGSSYCAKHCPYFISFKYIKNTKFINFKCRDENNNIRTAIIERRSLSEKNS